MNQAVQIQFKSYAYNDYNNVTLSFYLSYSYHTVLYNSFFFFFSFPRAGPIARALDQGAEVVVTGRCADSSMALGPLMHTVSSCILQAASQVQVYLIHSFNLVDQTVL